MDRVLKTYVTRDGGGSHDGQDKGEDGGELHFAGFRFGVLKTFGFLKERGLRVERRETDDAEWWTRTTRKIPRDG
jgi:hypothetical protein